MNQIQEIVLVGHCGPDVHSLKFMLSRIVGDRPIVAINDVSTLAHHVSPASLWLVNRVLDGDLGADDGVELIRQAAGRSPRPAMMLISNYPEAQADAVAAGALPGFGKTALRTPATMQLIQATLATAPPAG